MSTEILKEFALNAENEEALTTRCLSATHNYSMDSVSNCHVKDQKIQLEDLAEIIRGFIEEEEKKLVYFVTRIAGKNEATKSGKECGKYKPVVLHRDSYETVKDELNENKKLITTTHIAECGINLNGDVVIDLGQQFTYSYNDGIVEGYTSNITKANQIQRRGRVR